ncbi:nSTAND1 domain-containing NTPase [Streptomyces sp. 8N114]|uniref:nSTAND1 domain-containing NTPase n=1 Tax=Streptomyces sp. 8N114 TaxID=3457419 RepID=UPI003FCF96D4
MPGRTENPLDPSEGPVQRFAYELRKLRQEAGGPTYRAMARRVPYATATLAQAAAGRKLPSLPVALAYVAACGGAAEEWERRWHEAEAAQRDEPRPAAEDAVPPYPGLRRFQPEDRERFFGREQLTADLIALVRAQRLTALVGPSGSGKSSLLRAGLIPALRETAAPGERPVAALRETAAPGERPAAIRILAPGPHPARTHARLLTPDPAGGDTVVVIDQFEEIFTLCHDAAERAEFIGLLLTACRPGSRLRVVLAVRADFFGHCAGHRELADALRDATLLVGPMTPEELRKAVVGPATAAGLTVERALTARIVEEVSGEPGALPLMSHALLETWHRRSGGRLGVAGYEAAGGLHGAVARTAEEVYRQLPPEQAACARRILLLLVTPGEGAQDTRRTVGRTELEHGPGEEEGVVGAVLDRLARARLLSLDDGTVDLAHEALITSWPRLRGWIEEDREHLLVHRRLTGAAAEWEALARDHGALYRGSRLATAEEHFAETGREAELTEREAAFLAASIEARDEEQRAAVRRGRRLRALTIGLAVLLVVVTGVGLIAVQQRQRATDTRRDAVSRQLAAQAMQLADHQPGTAMLLSVEAYRTAPTPEARGALLTMSAHRSYRKEIVAHPQALTGVAFSRDGALATASGEEVRLWNPDRRSRRPMATLPTKSPVQAVTFSPDGRLLATGGDNGDLVLWDVEKRAKAATLRGHDEAVRSVAFSPDGHRAASGGADGTVRLWDVEDRTSRDTLTESEGPVNAVAFSPDGRTVSAVGNDGAVRIWSAGPSTATGKRLATLKGHTGPLDTVAFSPDGDHLATAGRDNAVRLWDVRRRESDGVLSGRSQRVRALAFSPNGHTLATAGNDTTVTLWDTGRRARKATLRGHTRNIYGLAFHPKRNQLASADEGGRVILWDPSQIPLSGHRTRLNDVAFDPDGRSLATASDDATLAVWDTRRRTRSTLLGRGRGPVHAVAFSHDGHTVAAATGDPRWPRTSTLTLRNPKGDSRPVRLTSGHKGRVMGVAFSPDGRTVATVGIDGKVVLWNARRHTRLATFDSGARWSDAVTFSPDGRLLASTHNTGTILWNVAERTRAATLRRHKSWVTDAAFSPDGRTLATSGRDERVILWDVADREPKATLTGSTGPAMDVAFSPDGRTLATAGAHSAVTLWDIDDREILATLSGHTQLVTALDFSPDGRTLATASNDTTARLWDTDPQRVTAQLCAALDRNLTHEEWRRFLPDSPYHHTCVPR